MHNCMDIGSKPSVVRLVSCVAVGLTMVKMIEICIPQLVTIIDIIKFQGLSILTSLMFSCMSVHVARAGFQVPFKNITFKNPPLCILHKQLPHRDELSSTHSQHPSCSPHLNKEFQLYTLQPSLPFPPCQ